MILSAAEYKDITRVSPLPDDVDDILRDAEEDVNAMTFNRIVAAGFDALTSFQQEKVKLAIAKQADFRRQYEGLINNPLTSYTVNGVSMGWDKSVIQQYGSVPTCSGVITVLRQTGLMYRGIM